jgi:hypothetical protein
MRAMNRLALILACSIAVPQGVAFPQEPAAAQPAAPAGVAGSWEGWARLTNDWPGLSCRYDGGPDATSVRLELTGEAGLFHGSVAIDLPAVQGSGCPPLRKRYAIREVSLGEGTASFTDSRGNEWTLALRRSGGVLQGMLAWQQGGAQEPLAEGVTRPYGVRPMARLAGEVRLARTGSGEPAEGVAAGGATAAPETAAASKASGGNRAGYVAAVIGANVVGLSALYAVNKLGKGSSGSGSLTCSPRSCIVGAPNSPCFCDSNSNVVTGASCGSTTAGQPLNAPCSVPDQPCQSGLSCNSNLCEDKFGRCPY